MAYVDYDSFVQENVNGYLVINGMHGTRANLTKAPHQLKIEADETKVITDIVRGINPAAWDAGTTYREGEYVSMVDGNGAIIISRSSADDNIGQVPNIGGDWVIQDINSIVGIEIQGENI